MYNTDFVLCHGNFYKKEALDLLIGNNCLSEIIEYIVYDLCVFLHNMCNYCPFSARASMLEAEFVE